MQTSEDNFTQRIPFTGDSLFSLQEICLDVADWWYMVVADCLGGKIMKPYIVALMLFVLLLLFIACPVTASDAGKRVYQQICSACHVADYFIGEDVDQLERNITKIVQGEIKHKKKFTLTDEEIVALAEYCSTGK